jgi:hypothetical protein
MEKLGKPQSGYTVSGWNLNPELTEYEQATTFCFSVLWVGGVGVADYCLLSTVLASETTLRFSFCVPYRYSRVLL